VEYKWNRTILVPILLLLASCGGEPTCTRYDAAALPHEREIVDDLVQVFVDLGYKEPCCPVHFCRAGESCQKVIQFCGAIHIHNGDPERIFVDVARPECTDPARTTAHEMLHAIGYRHGAAMDAAQAQILAEYRARHP